VDFDLFNSKLFQLKVLIYSIIKMFITLLYGDLITRKNIDGTDYSLFYEVSQHLTFFGQSKIRYEESSVYFIRQFINRESIVFDIGTNIGQFMLIFANLASKGKVVCMEPDTKNYGFATFNKNINKLQNVQIENLGVGSKEESLTFYQDSLTGGRRGSFKRKFVRDSYTGAELTIGTTTVAELIGKYGVPDFVKIDVEGFEAEVVEGIDNLNDQTTYMIEVRSSSIEPIYAFFKEHSFGIFIEDGLKLRTILDIDEIPAFANLFFLSKATQREYMDLINSQD